MPKELEGKLKQQVRKKGFTGKRADRYIYGTIAKRYKKVNGKWVKR